MHRPADIQHVRQPLDLNRALDAQVRPSPLRQRAVQRHVHRHRSVYHRRIDSHHVPGDHSVVCIHRSLLSDGDVFRLRLGDLKLRLQMRRLRHPRQHGSLRHFLPHFHIQLLQHPIDTGTNF